MTGVIRTSPLSELDSRLHFFLTDEEMDVVVDCDNREYHIDLGIKNFSIKHVRCRYIDINHNEITDMGVI